MVRPKQKTKAILTIPEKVINDSIYLIRGLYLLLDKDLASLYNVETKALNQAVKRNLERFPADFMFQLSKSEFDSLRSQIVTLKRGQHSKYLPLAFTEQGVAMLSSVLKSKRAVQVNIQIMRLFTKLRKAFLDHAELRLEIEAIKKKVQAQSQNIELVFSYLDRLVEQKARPRRKIGFLQK